MSVAQPIYRFRPALRLLPMVLAGLVLLAGAGGCGGQVSDRHRQALRAQGVQIRYEQGGYRLYRAGVPFYLRGVAGWTRLDQLAAIGGNAFRTYSMQGIDTLLAQAQALDLAVVAGLDLPKAMYFDYGDSLAVDSLIAATCALVRRYQDHPALLMWALGNEPDLHAPYDDLPRIWGAIDRIGQAIRATDSLHPLTTTINTDWRRFRQIRRHCPSVEVLGINGFHSIYDRKFAIKRYLWGGPYYLSEWAPYGAWETRQTHWDVPMEPHSDVKAAEYRYFYEHLIRGDTSHCLGGFAFFWGQKQERTHTWFSIFAESGEKTSIYDALAYVWSGTWPANRAPDATALTIDSLQTYDNPYLLPGEPYTAVVSASDPEGDTLAIDWELLPEGDYRYILGGAAEPRPVSPPGWHIAQEGRQLRFRSPETEGPYRLFVYVRDGQGGIGISNIPFYVMGQQYLP